MLYTIYAIENDFEDSCSENGHILILEIPYIYTTCVNQSTIILSKPIIGIIIIDTALNYCCT